MTSIPDLNFSMKTWYSSLLAEPQMPVICGSGGSWVDVRDCALAHVLSLEKSAAGGERMIIASPGMFTFKKILYFFFSILLSNRSLGLARLGYVSKTPIKI